VNDLEKLFTENTGGLFISGSTILKFMIDPFQGAKGQGLGKDLIRK
jgi:hypothetical protein